MRTKKSEKKNKDITISVVITGVEMDKAVVDGSVNNLIHRKSQEFQNLIMLEVDKCVLSK